MRNYLGRFGFSGERIFDPVAPFSGGEKARLVLAMIVWQRPNLLLLDEPAAGLALAERADMMALVRQVASQGVTVLYTEHNMDAVFGVADRVLVLMQGRLVADGLPEAVAQDLGKRVLAPQTDSPKLHKVLAQAGMGKY